MAYNADHGDGWGYEIVRSGWKPLDGLSQRVSIGAAAARSTTLTVGTEYLIHAKVDCWIVAGGASVDAVAGADFFLPAGVMFPYTAETGASYISVIRDASDSSNGLSICGARVS